MIFHACATRAEFIAAKGRDWAKIVKVDGGYVGFETLSAYTTWKAQK